MPNTKLQVSKRLASRATYAPMTKRFTRYWAKRCSVVAAVRANSQLWMSLLIITIIGGFLNRNVYAIGDDYHFFGFYFALGGMDYVEAVAQFWSSPFAAGRVFAPVFDLLPLSFMGSIAQFEWVRWLHLLLLMVIGIQIYRIASTEDRGGTLGGVLVLCAMSMPGVWHIYMVAYGTSMLVGMCAALGGAEWVARTKRSGLLRWSIFCVLALFVVFTYQPLWPLLFVGISRTILRARPGVDPETEGVNAERLVSYGKTYFGIAVVVACIFVLNYALVRYGYNSPRLSSGMELGAKIDYIVFELMPVAIYPWLYMFFPGSAWIVMLSWGTLLTLLLLVFRIISLASRGSARQKNKVLGLYRTTLIVLLGTGLVPLSLGMYVFTDQAVGFRRVLFASIYFWVVFLLALSTTFPRIAAGSVARYGLYAGFVSLAVVVAIFLDSSTQQLAAKEWKSAVCASRLSPINDRTQIDRSAVLLPVPFPSAMKNDEVQVRTLAYPTGAMLIWLAHMEVLAERPSFSPWALEISAQQNVDDWAHAYRHCAEKYARSTGSED